METSITRIKKRDGTVVLFDQSKITNAIFKAAQSVGGKDRKIALMLSDKVVKELENITLTPSIEQIQDTVEKILIEEGHAATAKAYILYRQERAAIRKEKQIVLEKEEVDEVDKKFDVNALRVLKARYLRKDATGKLIETPKQLFTRVAVHTALPDLFYDTRVFDIDGRQPVNMVEDFKPAFHEDQYGIVKYKLNRYHLEALKRMYDRFNRNKQMKVSFGKFFDMLKKGEFDSYEKNVDEFYNLMTKKLFMPNTPAIANFGNPLGMGSACFHPNQPVMTADGPREIRDVHVGDFVLTHKGRFRRVQEIFVRFADSLLQVNCENLPKPTMLLTEEHPVLSFKNDILQWVPISKLEEGDSVALSYPKTVVEVIKINENYSGNTVLLNDNLSDIDVKTMKFANINKISKVDYAGPVYNLEVEEDHSYVANMVAVHNCFVLDVPDSIEGIMETLKNTAIVFKAGGGMGYNFSKLRPEGDFVSTTGGVASGPLSFMRLFDTMTEVIKQGGCVATDTMVRTDKGLVPMLNMLNSPPLRDNPTNYFVYDGQEYSHAWLAQNNGIASVYTIETELGNELKATGNHLMAVATENGIEWKRVDSIKEGDWLVTVLGGHQGKKIELPQIEKQHHNSTPLKIPEYLNEELAEILGLYVADGCFNRGRLIFSVDARDKDLITRIEYLMQKVFGLSIGEKRDKVTYFDIVFFSKDLEKLFNELRWMKDRSWNAFVPDDIFRSEEPVVCAFLRGLFEGDGSIHPDGYPILYSSSKTLIDQVQQLLLSLGIVAKVHKVTKSEKRYGKRQMYKIIILTDKSINIFKKNIGFISQKKMKFFEQYSKDKKIEYSDLIPTFQTIFSKYYKRVGRGSAKGRAKKGANIAYYRDVYHYLKNDRTLTRTKLQKLIKKHQFLNEDKILSEFSSDTKFFTRVTKISNGLETYTMEIEIPSTSSYIANGLLVHNIRRGANMGILNSNHPDIEKFITAKEGNKGLRNFNISMLIMGDFWKYYENDEPYPLVNPKDGKVVKYVSPRALFDKIVYQAWESAEPGVIFFDRVNDYNPFYQYLGPIVTTNPCVTGDTLIATENGLERIDSIKTKNIIVDIRTQTADNSLVAIQKGCKMVEASQIVKTGIKDTYKLAMKSGYEITATADHKVLTENGWKEISKLTAEDSILLQSGKGSFNKNAELPFKVNNLAIGKNGRKYESNLPTEWSKELGLLLGWLTGDGWLSEKYNSMGFVFAPEDKEIKELMKPIFENYCKREVKEMAYDNGCVQIRSSSKYVVEFFKKLGVKEERCVPSALFTATEEAVIGFMQGLFAADGTIGMSKESRNYIRLNSSSIRLLKEVQLLLLNLGIRSSIYDRSTKQKEFKYTNSKGELIIYKTSGTNYELNISKENVPRFMERVGAIHNKLKSKVERLKGFEFYEEYFTDKVKSIEYAGKREVYDITEPSTHSFIANGIIVHNCGEVLLYPNEPCNLGSINVWTFARHDDETNENYVDWDALRVAVRSCTRFLDNVIDVNNFPLKAIEEMSLATRKIGLGVMGIANLLYELKLPYNSEEGRQFMEKLMEFVAYWSKAESIELAKLRGNLPYYEKSFYKEGRLPIPGPDSGSHSNLNWDKIKKDIKQYGIRNGYTTIIAPTGSISMIAGCSSGMEPVYSVVFEKNVKVGSFFYIDPAAEKVLREEGLFNEKLLEDINRHKGSIQNIDYVPEKIRKALVTAMDINPEDHIRALAAFQKWTDSSISKTNNFPANATVEDMRQSYILAYQLGCKDVTVFRDTSIKDQVLVAPSAKSKEHEVKAEAQPVKQAVKEAGHGLMYASDKPMTKSTIKNCPECGTLLTQKEGCVECPNCGWGLCM